ncbi:MAG: hypothetical protein Ct9H300mP1_02110 [Planctomycetaceae bacterium]|nr:MAG: hypothetical protein Ct9H300mP1_02110 [Planctomycetaceae bacterium]
MADFIAVTDPAQTIVTHDSGNPPDQLMPIYKSTTPRGYLGWGHSTQLGFGLGAIMGAKLAEPGKLCANFMGDAAIGMVGMDIETAVREEIPILTVVLKNSAMGNYEKHIPISVEKYGTKYLTGDYADLPGHWGPTENGSSSPATSVRPTNEPSRPHGKDNRRCSSSSPAKNPTWQFRPGPDQRRSVPHGSVVPEIWPAPPG